MWQAWKTGLLLGQQSGDVPQVGSGAMLMLVLFIVGSLWIGVLANRAASTGGFMKGFFLGNRGLGVWALALTATIQSGGTFMGFPSLVYSHGWIVALWIGSYMVVPITGFGILGKRLAQLSRRTGAITVPDMFRVRFGSPTLGLMSTLFILFYLSFLMFAQFKAGAIVLQLAWPGGGDLALSEDVAGISEWRYHVGLLVFATTVVAYTLAGGFLAAVWTDLFQSVLMFAGVLLLLVACLSAVGGLEQATLRSLANTGPGFVFGPGYSADGSGQQFLPISLAISFFVVWIWGGVGAPAGLVRLMASQNTNVIRKSIYVLSIYNLGIYLPLIVICVCGRALLPNLAKSDEIVPRLALLTTADWPGGSLVAGLILAAPFGAVMSTVSSYLVVLSSGVVRDIYQRLLRPQAPREELRLAAWVTMILSGLISVAVMWSPPKYLQVFIVFSTSGAAATFLVPAVMACYWRRATPAGVGAGMVSGAGVVLFLYLCGIMGWSPAQSIGAAGGFRPWFLLGLEPLIWGLLASSSSAVLVSLLTVPLPAEHISRLFDRRTGAEGEAV
ncbi:MAG: sodium:solute symporter family transporter [Planctomyces sp.]|jgi:sodium/pantothenate symporter